MNTDLKIVWNLFFKIFPIPNNDEVIDQVTFVKDSPEIKAVTEEAFPKHIKSSTTYILTPPVNETIEKIKRLIIIKAIHNCIYEQHFPLSRNALFLWGTRELVFVNF